MVLTAHGKRILDAGEEILTKVSALEQEITASDTNVRQLRITTQCYTCYHWLPVADEKISIRRSLTRK